MNPINAKSVQLIELHAFAYCLLSVSLSESFDFLLFLYMNKMKAENVLQYKDITIYSKHVNGRNHLFLIHNEDTTELIKPVLQYYQSNQVVAENLSYSPTIKIIKGANEDVIQIWAEHKDGGLPVYDALYSMVGELLAVRYSLRISVYKGINVMSIGDYEYILETYGITDIEEQTNNKAFSANIDNW